MNGPAYEIGKYYRVPTVYGKYCGILAHWPVLGPLHRDEGVVNFPYLHIHVDYRFVPQAVLNRRRCEWRNGDGIIMRNAPLIVDLHGKRWEESGAIQPQIKPRRMKCKRQWPTLNYSFARWTRALEDEQQSKRMKAGICPHRGADLSNLPIDADGCVQCPLHGLRWHVESGRLVRWTEPAA
ncbi:Rieske 2Fe-2S domain-containing protein [Algiphilus sp. W345]|uniref:Rieske 2Fe-2S domain-containing protein n=1 Tax=Banduia mediterranea TaxID=3075609 RepID=A0ABU2WHE3_9GAMM|nr:Rieske 2Fe-2S domain-containing protein [Algiphilus sp. W345]MDT0496497.1 Rieske 2Fe-2S domain-containing protein [Algiphilus sp. W345]